MGILAIHFGKLIGAAGIDRHENELARRVGLLFEVPMMVILMAGLMMAALDPNIRSVEDGIWWAWVTVTTVGYGDVVPTSTAGRVFGGLIILFGIGLFAMITASLAAFFVSRQEEEMLDEERETLLRLAQLDDRLIRLEEKLDRLLDIRGRDRG